MHLKKTTRCKKIHFSCCKKPNQNNVEIDAVANYLNRIREKGKTLVIIDHSMGVEEYFSQWIQIEKVNDVLSGNV